MFRCFLLLVLVRCVFPQNANTTKISPFSSAAPSISDWKVLTGSQVAIVAVFFSIFFLAFLISCGVLIKFHSHYHVEGRMPVLIWGMAITQAVRVIVSLLQVTVQSPCWIDRMAYFLVFPMFAVLWARATRLIFQWEISQKLNEFHSLSSDKRTTEELYRGRGGFFVKNRHWITPKYMYSAIAIYVLIHFGLALETCREDCPQTLTCNNFACKVRDARLIMLYLVEFFLFFCFATYRLRKRYDVFLVRRELIVCFCLDFLTVIGGTILLTSFNSELVRYIFASCGFTLTGCFVIWLPVYLDIRMDKKNEVVPATKLTVATVLSDKAGFKSMTSFLKSEFSAENAYFFQRVEEFRMSANKGDGSAEYIFDTFIAANSPYQVNLSAHTVAAIAAALNRPNLPPKTIRAMFAKPGPVSSSASASSNANSASPPNPRLRSLSKEDMRSTMSVSSTFTVGEEEIISLFDAAQAEILNLLEKDSWVRYLQSPQFAKYSRRQMKIANEYIDIVEEKMRTTIHDSASTRHGDSKADGNGAPSTVETGSTGGRKSTGDLQEASRKSTGGLVLDTLAAVRRLTSRQHDSPLQPRVRSIIQLECSTNRSSQNENASMTSVTLPLESPTAMSRPDHLTLSPSDSSVTPLDIPHALLALQVTSSDSAASEPETASLFPQPEGFNSARTSDSTPVPTPDTPMSALSIASANANRDYLRLDEL